MAKDDIVPEQWVRMVGAAAAVGLLTGSVILAVKAIVEKANEELLTAEPWVVSVVLLIGVLSTALIVQWFAGRSASTTDRYIEQFHDDPAPIDLRHAPGRLAASVSTGASGVPMGLEGPAVYAGSAVATTLRRRFAVFSAVDVHSLFVAGAAAGVAAVFKAPLAGVLFALEAPYRRTFVHSAVLPALVGSTVGYLTLIVVKGTEPLLELPPVEVTVGYVFGAVVLGIICGLAARAFARLIHHAERFSTRQPAIVRGLVAGALLVGLYLLGRAATDENVAITAGFNAAEWALDPGNSVALLLLVLGIRVAATSVAVGGGMVGGLFVPLVAMGAIVGALVADVASLEETTLYVIVGAAAFLGAGYGTPLAAVAFVAEITGLPGFIIPGLVAVAAAQLVMSNRTVSPAQTEPTHSTEATSRGHPPRRA